MNDGFIVCSAKQACNLMKHLNDNDIVILSVLNKKTFLHEKNRNIKKKKGEELIKQAETISYKDNDYFCI